MSANKQVTDVAVYESYDTTKAKQKANRDYADMVGVKQQLKIIKILTVVAIVFGLASVVSSSFGFYYDFIQVLGAYTVWVAVVLGVTIETLKVVSIWGAFADWNGNVIIKGSFVVLLILFTTLALVLHFRGLTNYETVTVKDTISKVRADALALTKQREARADKLTDLNVKTVHSVLNNGTAYDDGLVVKSMSQNNKMIASLKSTGVISDVDLMYIEQQKKSAETMKNALGVVFPIIELLAVLGVFIMFLKKYSTSEGVREFISNREKMNDMEANYFDMVNQTMRDDFMRMMRGQYEAHANRPDDPFSYNNMSAMADAINRTNKEKEDECGELEQESKPKLISPNFKSRVNECEDIEDVSIETEVSADKEFQRAIDFSAFSEQEGILIKLLWNNGNIKVGEYLIDRDTVIEEASTNFGLKRAGSILTNLYDNLRLDHKMIERPKPNLGYKAKVALKKELWTEVEKQSL